LPPVLGFLVAATVLAVLVDAAGVFDAAAQACLAAARGSRARLFALVALLATLTTAVLSLDTTAVLLTPVVLAACRRAALPVRPFALLVLWLCAGASLVIPVSNLTSLLAADRVGLDPVGFARAVAPAGLAAATSMVVVLALWHRRELRGGFDLPPAVSAPSRPLLIVGTAVCVALVPALLLGVVPWLAATVAAVGQLGATAVLRRDLVRISIPWTTVAVAIALVAVVSSLGTLGLEGLRHSSRLTVGLTSAGLADVADNIPAYLLLERTGADPLAILVGVNLGCLVTPWGMLATLLWRDRCRAAGVSLPWRGLLLGNVVGCLIAVLVATGVRAL
jgi:Na+/H+ antiporter NhaD/arsenite permease-like protein